MKPYRHRLFATISAAACCALLLGVAPSTAQPAPSTTAASTLPAARDFARDAQIEGLTISPDGSHIAGIISPDGNTRYVAVWETANPEKPPLMFGNQRMLILQVSFIKNDRLGVFAQQLFTEGSTRTHLQKLFITDLAGKDWKPALPESNSKSEIDRFIEKVSNPAILDTLPNDPQNILVLNTRLDGAGDIYKVNLYKDSAERISRGSEKFGSPQVDLKGEVRARQELNFENGAVYVAQWIRNPANGNWEEHFRSYAKDRNLTEVVGFTTDPNIIYVNVTRNGDKAGVYEYDISQRKITQPAFEYKKFEAGGPVEIRKTGQLLGFTYQAERSKVYWADPKMDGIAKAVSTALGVKTTAIPWVDVATGEKSKISVADGFDTSIVDWSDNLKYVVVNKSGPNLPPEYYLLTDGSKLSLLGKSRPQINTAELGDSRLIQYAARDGLMIPAFLHTPPKTLYGEGPYPAIVLPHGGPSARDELDWDVSGWTKYFTARGYVVIQPQFRGSVGWGTKLARAGDAEWGKKMQDDNDDAAKWLIDQKLAAPDRIALFGYSYGGYAAFVAAIRPNGLYQCSIAGAGVAEIARFQGETYDNRFLREYQRPTIDGLDPLSNAKSVSIPIFVYHGDRDQTVQVDESRKFVNALKAAGKTYKYLEIKDMGHQYNLMTPAMIETQLVEIEKYLKTDCGPGGL